MTKIKGTFTAKEFYTQRVNEFELLLIKMSNVYNLISNIRLLVVVSTLILCYLMFRNLWQISGMIFIISGISLFIYMCSYHKKINRKIKQVKNLIDINKKGIKRVNDEWCDFDDQGEEFINDEHPYSTDLDVFGRSSVFQWINATHTYLGRLNLAKTLSGCCINTDGINKTQEAIDELSESVEFRQSLEEIGYYKKCSANPEKTLSWLESQDITTSKWLHIVKFLPLISFSLLLLDVFVLKIYWLSISFYGIQTGLFLYINFKRIVTFSDFDRVQNTLQSYSKLFLEIEKKQFSTDILNHLKTEITDNKENPASKATYSLSQILVNADIRYNPLAHFLANVILLWDLRCILRIISWRNKYGQRIRYWLNAVAEFETLSSFAIIRFENPQWCTPEIDDNTDDFYANKISHPLIIEKINIPNDFSIKSETNICILTGSNMSGKSTFLRTIAVNLILAYCGAPVCAESMKCKKYNIITSMRTKDILKGNVSTFYSELLRIKSMLKSAESNIPTFFLIDEMFSGTNSIDRVIGAKAVLKSLAVNGIKGLISTHDLELCSLGNEFEGRYVNYHFREFYEKKSIKFDYKLYPGPSTTKNALYLLKMVGIPVEKDELERSDGNA